MQTSLGEASAPGGRETPDVASSSDAYARRFAGPVGRWFLERQASLVLDLLASLPPGSLLLDLGGGHAHLLPSLLEAGFRVTVLGSPEASRERLRPWLESGRCTFVGGELTRLPLTDRSYAGVLAIRMLAHLRNWTGFVEEMCRCAHRHVIVDFPSSRSLNVVARPLFGLKRTVEGNTRPFRVFRPAEIGGAFERAGFRAVDWRPQFLFPMALHRAIGLDQLSRILEAPGRVTGITKAFGSPVLARFDRA